MASGRQKRIAEQKRQEFRDRQQFNRIKGRLDREYTEMRNQGMTPEQIFAAQAAGQTTTPGAVTAPGPQPTGYTNAPAWAQQAYDPAAAAPTQWWQRGTPTQAVTSGPGTPKVMPRPTEKGNPFGSVTGSTGRTPTVPAWLGGIGAAGLGTQGLGALQGAAVAARGTQNPEWWRNLGGPTMQGRSTAEPGTLGSRRVDPLTGIPDFPMLSSLGSAPPTTGGGYYTNWKKWKKGGGGRRKWYSPPAGGYVSEGRDQGPFVPSAGQANWNIG